MIRSIIEYHNCISENMIRYSNNLLYFLKNQQKTIICMTHSTILQLPLLLFPPTPTTLNSERDAVQQHPFVFWYTSKYRARGSCVSHGFGKCRDKHAKGWVIAGSRLPRSPTANPPSPSWTLCVRILLATNEKNFILVQNLCCGKNN